MRQRYDSYKPSGIDWIGDIPNHWKVVPIKQICRSEKYAIKTGPFGSQLKGEDLQETGDIRVYNQRNVIDNNFSEVSSFVTSEKAKDLDSFYTLPNDLLVTSRGTIGKSAILPKSVEMGILHSCLIALRIDDRKANLKWVQRWINESEAFRTEIASKSNATTIDVIYTETLKNIRLALPPLAEQEAIAAWLDEKCGEIDAAIAKVDREIELIDELKQSEISRVVTRGLNPDAPLRPSGIDWIGNILEHWKIVPIKSLGFFTKGLTFTKADLADEGKSVISYGQIHSKLNDKVGIRRELIRYIPDRICLNNASSLTKKGDFIFADTSEDLQGCGNAVYNDTLIPLYGGYHTIILHSFSEDNKYFGYLFLTDAWRSQIRASVSGVKVYSITQSILKNCNILVPPLSEQQAIADYLDKKCAEIDGLKAKLTKKRETLTELRQSIISEVVTGKRKVI